MDFSKRLKSLRERKGLSQEGLSKKLNIPRSTITNYETVGDRLPRQQRLNEIADFFGVSVDYLIGRTDNNQLTVKEDEFLNDIDELSFEKLIDKHVLTIDGKPASEAEIKAAISFIRSLRDFPHA